MPRQTGRRLVYLALAALALGTAVYLLDRDWQSARFLAWLGTWIPAHVPGDYFGAAGQWLPSFSHTFGFSILTAAVLGWSVRARLAGCTGWVAVNVLFEMLQVMPDRLDLAAVVAGGLVAFALMALLVPSSRASRFRPATLAAIGTLGVASIVASGPQGGPTDIRSDTDELQVYGFTIRSGGSAPAEWLVTRRVDGLDYTDAVAFTGAGLSGTFNRTTGFTLDAGSTFRIDTDRSTPALGSLDVTIIEDIREIAFSVNRLESGTYRAASGPDSILVRIIPETSAGFGQFELSLNNGPPVVVHPWFVGPDAPLWQRQAIKVYSSLNYLLIDVIEHLSFRAVNQLAEVGGSVPVQTACDEIAFAPPLPESILNPGSVTTTRKGPGSSNPGDDWTIAFAECAFGYTNILQYADLYRGDLTLQDATSTTSAQNILTNFGFGALRFEDLQAYSIVANPPPTSWEPGTVLAGGFAMGFFPP